MNVQVLLFLILFILMAVVGGKRGIKSFFTLCFNFIILFFILILISYGLDPIKVTVFGCITISSITLFYINGFNKKTVSALISVIFVVLFTMLITYKMGENAKIQGFSYEQFETISVLSLYVKLNFTKIVICQILIGLLGAIIDVSISISSSMNEIYKNNLLISEISLLKSGINIGKDILGTMTNTLLFAYIGGFMTLIIYFNELKYAILDILNKKVFVAEVFQILCSGIGIILIIPITAFISMKILMLKTKKPKMQETVRDDAPE
jgi:uncharacterized membrane protein